MIPRLTIIGTAMATATADRRLVRGDRAFQAQRSSPCHLCLDVLQVIVPAETKSNTFTVPPARTFTFGGLRSRWMIPCSCAAWSVSAICLAIGSPHAVDTAPHRANAFRNRACSRKRSIVGRRIRPHVGILPFAAFPQPRTAERFTCRPGLGWRAPPPWPASCP